MNTIFVVGGGPSLRKVNLRCLANAYTISVNRSFEIVPHSNVIYFSDKRFWDWYADELRREPGLKITGSPHINDPTVLHYQFTGARGLEREPGKLRHGNNSGYAAINLAYLFGARRIILLGFDLRFSGDRSHWHDGYPIKNREETLTQKMRPYFDGLAAELKSDGVEVLNACPRSALDCFEKITIEEALRCS